MSKVDHRRSQGRHHQGGERERLELELAQAAARILIDGEADDFGDAKRRAADYLGVAETRSLPDNRQVMSAIVEYQRLFDAAGTAERTIQLRQVALSAMKNLAEFQPRLVGPVLYGTAFEHSPITLHLFSDELEAVTRFLMARRIPYTLDEKSFRLGGRQFENFIVVAVEFQQQALDLVVMPHVRLAHPPLSPLDGAPYRRLAMPGLAALLDSPDAAEVLPEIALLRSSKP